MKVVILGAGITGLSAAYKLLENGFEVEIIEQESEVGGLARSVNRNGNIFDHGPHGYHSVFQEIIDWYKFIAGDELTSRAKELRVFFRGKYYKYPIEAKDVILKADPILATRCIFNYLSIQFQNLFAKPTEKTMEDWVVNRFGRAIYEIFFGPYTQKVWGVHPAQLSASFGKYRIPTRDMATSILKSFRKGEKKRTGKEPYYAPLVLKIYYPKRGAGSIPNKLYQMIIQKGGKFHLNSKAVGIDLEKEVVKSVIYEQSGNKIKVEADYFVSTIPITTLIEMLWGNQDKAKEFLSEVYRKIRFRSVVMVCLLINHRMSWTAQSLYFYDRLFTRVSDMKNFGGKETSPVNKTGLLCEIPCDFGDHIWTANERYLCEDVINELVDLNFFCKEDVEDKFVLKIRYGYPIYLLGYENTILKVIEALSKIENLLTGGRQGLYKYIDMDVATLSGFKMAEHIIQNKRKIELLNLPLEERLYA